MPVHFESQILAPDSSDAVEKEVSTRAGYLQKLTRRSFLVACVAGCSQVVVPPTWPERGDETWALLSDTHISRRPEQKFGRSCMADNLRQVVHAIVDLNPDHILVNGDIAYMRGRAGDYTAFLDLMSPLRLRGVPTHMTLGNHDHRTRLTQSLSPDDDRVVAEKAVSSRRINKCQWLFLDSLERTQAVRGSLGLAQLAWLERRLDADPYTPAIICLHHNPEFSIVGLKDFSAFERIVLPRRQVKLVLFGHTHTFRVWQSEELHFVNLPAVGFRLRPGTSLGWICANLRTEGARLIFHGITRREKEDGLVQELCWRSS